MKCRSDPHVVVSLTCTMTSWGLSIDGSSTVSTDRSLMPFQTSALMSLSPSSTFRGARAGVVLDGRHLASHDQCPCPVERLEGERAGECARRGTAHSSNYFGAASLRGVAELEDDTGVCTGARFDESKTGVILGDGDALPLRPVGSLERELPAQPVRTRAGDV